MAKIDRRLFRDRMKKEFKKFVKENPAYKHMTFAQFSELVKINMVKLQKQTAPTPVLSDHTDHDHTDHDHSHDHSHDHELDDMFTAVVEDTNETTVNE